MLHTSTFDLYEGWNTAREPKPQQNFHSWVPLNRKRNLIQCLSEKTRRIGSEDTIHDRGNIQPTTDMPQKRLYIQVCWAKHETRITIARTHTVPKTTTLHEYWVHLQPRYCCRFCRIVQRNLWGKLFMLASFIPSFPTVSSFTDISRTNSRIVYLYA